MINPLGHDNADWTSPLTSWLVDSSAMTQQSHSNYNNRNYTTVELLSADDPPAAIAASGPSVGLQSAQPPRTHTHTHCMVVVLCVLLAAAACSPYRRVKLRRMSGGCPVANTVLTGPNTVAVFSSSSCSSSCRRSAAAEESSQLKTLAAGDQHHEVSRWLLSRVPPGSRQVQPNLIGTSKEP